LCTTKVMFVSFLHHFCIIFVSPGIRPYEPPLTLESQNALYLESQL
jgi:hypothetical protein